jgi:hypothetical protein
LSDRKYDAGVAAVGVVSRTEASIGDSFYLAAFYEKAVVLDQSTKEFCEIAVTPIAVIIALH